MQNKLNYYILVWNITICLW